jgi:hypothetical protein
MFAVGTQVGKYTLRRKLGQGGFGAVFAGYDESLEREVALKILNAEHKASDDVMRRFLQEARLAARIGHPGITTVFECAMLPDGVAYIAMELLDGESLAHRLHRAGRMAPSTAMEIARQIASALEAAHKNGIVHRDLKPDNVFLVKDPAVPGGERIKVLDFGIAKLHHQSTGVHTQTNEVFGTPRYMSPEQCRSSTQIDQRSDIYTLGCILFELLTGRPPFMGQTGELFAQHLMVEAPSVLTIVKETPYHVAELVGRMLAKDVEARPQTMADVQRELELSSGVSVGVPPTLPPGVSGQLPPQETDSTLKAAAGMSVMTEPMSRTPRALIAAAAGIAILLAVALVVWLRGSGEGTTPVAAAAPEKVEMTVEPLPPSTPKVEDVAKVDAAKADATRADAAKADAAQADANDARTAKRDARRESKRDKAAADKLAADKAAAKPVDPKTKTVNPFAATPPATGTLVLRSTPPCEILVDGRAIAASTPHELKLAAGKHRITLVHDEQGIQDSFSVEIKAGGTERVNRDLHEKVKAKKRNATINPFGGN